MTVSIVPWALSCVVVGPAAGLTAWNLMERCGRLFFTGGLGKHVPVTCNDVSLWAHCRQFGNKGREGLRFGGWFIHVSFYALLWRPLAIRWPM